MALVICSNCGRNALNWDKVFLKQKDYSDLMRKRKRKYIKCCWCKKFTSLRGFINDTEK